MTPKKPINPFAAITDKPLAPPPPARDTAAENARNLRWIKWLLLGILLVNLTTCSNLSSVVNAVGQMRVY